MDRNCFNLVVRKIMFDDIQTAQKTKRLIVKHYLDMKFWGGTLPWGSRSPRVGSQGKAPQTELDLVWWVGVLPSLPTSSFFFFSL
ncbi:hypothetical protein ZWY2020_056372 [Hordeum vulgare]|nr:hypothetical protein ZWY2020_056372 [Hordeum vulgare]